MNKVIYILLINLIIAGLFGVLFSTRLFKTLDKELTINLLLILDIGIMPLSYYRLLKRKNVNKGREYFIFYILPSVLALGLTIYYLIYYIWLK